MVESLLPSALLSKVFLTKPQLEKCLQSEGIAFPVEGSKGRIIKRDIANALVDHVFADKPEDVRGQVLNRLARDSAPEPEQDMEDCPIEILQVINEMDQDNKDHFQGVLKQAANLLAKRVQAETERNARRRAGQQQAPGAGRAGGAEAPANEAAAAGPALDPAAAAGAAANAAEPAAPAVGAEAEQDSPRRRANLGRAKAPEEFRSLLPPLGHLHFYYQPRQRRVVVEFASILSGVWRCLEVCGKSYRVFHGVVNEGRCPCKIMLRIGRLSENQVKLLEGGCRRRRQGCQHSESVHVVCEPVSCEVCRYRWIRLFVHGAS